MPEPKSKRRGASQKRAAKSPAPGKLEKKVAARKTPKSKATQRGAKAKTGEPLPSEEEAAFTEALIQSGQAACLDSEGKLPAGATHKIVEDPDGQIKVVRRRFSIS